MVDMIKKQFRLRRDELLLGFIVMCLCFILGAGMMILIISVDSETLHIVPIGMVMALMGTIMTLFMAQVFSFGNRFNQALSMGRTRKIFMVADTLVTLGLHVVYVITLYILYFVEIGIYKIIFPTYTMKFDFLNRINWKYAVGGIIVLIIAELLFGELILKFGMKIFWIIWAMWMLGTSSISALSNNVEITENASVLQKIMYWFVGTLDGITAQQWNIIWGAIVVAAAIGVVAMVRKQAVKY